MSTIGAEELFVRPSCIPDTEKFKIPFPEKGFRREGLRFTRPSIGPRNWIYKSIPAAPQHSKASDASDASNTFFKYTLHVDEGPIYTLLRIWMKKYFREPEQQALWVPQKMP